jgi:group I intron endonuclease
MDTRKSGVYLIRCLPTGAVYIGSSRNSVLRRWNDHRRRLELGRHTNPHLLAAWRKYGPDAFEFALLEVVEERKQILTREQHWIDCYWGGKMGVECYNASPTAGSTRLMKQSPEAVAKTAAYHRGRKHSPEQIANRAAALRGKKRSPEQRQRIAEAHKGLKPTPEQIAKQKATWKAGNNPLPTPVTKTYEGFVAPDGTVYRDVTNLHQFCRLHGLDSSSMCKVYYGKLHKHRGWRRLR